MKFMLLVCVDPGLEPAAGDPTIEQWLDEVEGKRLDGSELGPVRDAATVRVRGGEVLLADGPFAETKEFIAGYDIVECPTLEEAVRIAARHPCARFGAVEVRPFAGN
jgi:hypothetical protein